MTPLRGSEALARLLEYPEVERILDIGSGDGRHAAAMKAAGKIVTTVSMEAPADHVGDYLALEIPGHFDAVWASHVLEHQPNPGAFLRRCNDHLRPGGVLAVTVPPPKNEIVGGHVSLWNSGLLIYHLILAGFDCRAARVSGCYPDGPGYAPYNLSVIVCKRPAELPALACDKGDIERLARFFPLPVRHGFDGRLPPINW